MGPALMPRSRAVYSTAKNKLEVKLESVEAETYVLLEARRQNLRRNFCSRMWAQLRRRTAFLATPPSVWFFLIALGIATAISVYVDSHVASCCRCWCC